MTRAPSDSDPQDGHDVNDDEVEASSAPLIAHLAELRRRLIIVLSMTAVAFGACFFVAEPLYFFLLAPFEAAARDLGAKGQGLTLIFTAPLEFFFTKMKLALFAALVLVTPVLAYQVYAFVAPGLYRRERRAIWPFLLASPVLFLMGAGLVYGFILPFVLRFALSQEAMVAGQVAIELLPKVSDYLALVTTLILAFGFCFQMPLVLVLLGLAGVVTAQQLSKFRRYAIAGVFVLAAFVTPPDPLSQILLAVPLLLLYEASVILVRLLGRKPAKPVATDPRADVPPPGA